MPTRVLQWFLDVVEPMVKVPLNLSIRTRWTHFSNKLNPDIENSYFCLLLPSRRYQLWYWTALEVVSRNLMRLLAMKWLCQSPVLVSSYNDRIWNSNIHSATARQRLLIDLQFNFTGTLYRKSTHFWLVREYFVNRGFPKLNPSRIELIEQIWMTLLIVNINSTMTSKLPIIKNKLPCDYGISFRQIFTIHSK